MKRLLGTIVFLLVPLLGSVVVVSQASAQSEIYLSDAVEALAPNIVNGTIISRATVVVDGQPHQVHELQITDSLKGDLEGLILVETPGGNFGDGRVADISHAAYFTPNRHVQLALVETDGRVGNDLSIAIDPSLAAYSIVSGAAGAVELLRPGVGRAGVMGEGTDFLLSGVAWPNFDTPVQFWVNPTNSGVGATATINAVKRGFQMLEDNPASSIDFEFAGTTTKSGWDDTDGQVVVSWVNWAPTDQRLAVTQWVSIVGTGELVEFDIILSNATDWANGAESGHFDIGTIIGHEVGHGVGLAHTDPPLEGQVDNPVPSPANLMYHTAPVGSTKPLGPGDSAGLAQLYPQTEFFCAGLVVTVNLNLGESPTSGDDVILGTPGDDNIDGRAGNDTICAGSGYDTVHGGHGDDYIEGGRQGDYLYGDQGNDRILGESGNDRLFGDGDDDELFGNTGNDKLYGGNGLDLLRGGDGRDSIYGNNDNDKLYGGGDDDRLYGESGNDRLWGDAGEDKLNGSNGDDEMYGGDGADVISGSKGDDLLDGGGGNDTLDGGSNQDECDGAGGVDTAERCEITTNA